MKHERRGADRIINGKQKKSVRDKLEDKDIHTELELNIAESGCILHRQVRMCEHSRCRRYFHIGKLMLALGKVIVSINETRRARIAVEKKFNWVTALQALCIS